MKQICCFCQGDCRPTGDTCHDNKKIKVVQCRKCHLIQLEKFSHIGKNYYLSTNYLPKNWSSERVRQHPWNKKRIQRLLEWIPDLGDQTLLDFGCGTGGFLETAQTVFKKVYGFDLSRTVCRNHKKRGLSCVSSLEKIPPDKIDIVTLFHVLEHVPEPWTLLKSLSNRFKNLKNIVIEVPNTEEALLSLFQNRDYRENHHHTLHLYYFTDKTLKKIVKKAGLIVEHTTQLQKYPMGNHLEWLSNQKGEGQYLYPLFNDDLLNEHYERLMVQQGIADSLFLLARISNRCK